MICLVILLNSLRHNTSTLYHRFFISILSNTKLRHSIECCTYLSQFAGLDAAKIRKLIGLLFFRAASSLEHVWQLDIEVPTDCLTLNWTCVYHLKTRTKSLDHFEIRGGSGPTNACFIGVI